MKVRGVLLGALIGLALSCIISFFTFAIALGMFGGGGSSGFEGLVWLITSSVIPFVILFAISGFFIGFRNLNRLKFWVVCTAIGFFAVLYMGTAGAIIASGLEYGFSNVNISGYLQWGPIYALAFLPVSAPIVALTQILIQYLLDRQKFSQSSP